MAIEIHGHCAKGFEAVRDELAAALGRGEEIGAAVAVDVGGENVVDLWAGHADPGRTRPWQQDTIANVFSTTKGVVANGGDADGVHVLGPDLVLKLSTRFGLGFMLSQPGNAFGPNDGAFGHPGAGGSVAFADPKARVGFAYVMNRMGPCILIDPRAKALMAATYGCLKG